MLGLLLNNPPEAGPRRREVIFDYLELCSGLMQVGAEFDVLTAVTRSRFGKFVDPSPKRLTRFSFQFGTETLAEKLLEPVDLTTQPLVVLSGQG